LFRFCFFFGGSSCNDASSSLSSGDPKQVLWVGVGDIAV
jgi:hypothetical protein